MHEICNMPYLSLIRNITIKRNSIPNPIVCVYTYTAELKNEALKKSLFLFQPVATMASKEYVQMFLTIKIITVTGK
jgi:hypothetical protein